MQLAHDPGIIVFPTYISLHVGEVEPGLDHPTYMPKLACVK